MDTDVTPSEITTTCCIVGGGPAGVMLAYLLARQGIDVTLLEAHADFDRQFRGDTLHPSTMELLDELGLADKVLQIRHSEMRTATVSGVFDAPFVDFGTLPTRFPYIAILPQNELLDFMVEEAKQFPSFRVIMRAKVTDLIEEDGVVRGVRFVGPDGEHTVRALLTVGADGRFSRVRKLANIDVVSTSSPMDVMWFCLPRRESDGSGLTGRIGNGHLLLQLDRGDVWQIGFLILKGSFQEVKAAGLPTLHQEIAELAPELADRVQQLDNWHDFALLSVESSYAPRWHRPGVLLIGDAAHVMSPVGGVGINYAVQDAVAAAKYLSAPLRAGHVSEDDLAAVQRRRALPTKFIQALQTFAQKQVLARVLNDDTMQVPPLIKVLAQVPLLRQIPARLIGYGFWPMHIRSHRN